MQEDHATHRRNGALLARISGAIQETQDTAIPPHSRSFERTTRYLAGMSSEDAALAAAVVAVIPGGPGPLHGSAAATPPSWPMEGDGVNLDSPIPYRLAEAQA